MVCGLWFGGLVTGVGLVWDLCYDVLCMNICTWMAG